MIFDDLKNIARYKGISRYLDKAIEFLENTDLTSLPIGKTEIWKDKVFANVMEVQAKDKEEIEFEIHRKFMDIQIDIKGKEIIEIGLDMEASSVSYKEETDFGKVSCKKAAECILGEGRFIVCMKEEPHKPSIAAGEEKYLKKCVIKVAAEQEEEE